MLTKTDKDWLYKNFVTKDDLKKSLIGLARSNELDELKITFVTNLDKWKSELFDKIDTVLKRLNTAEQEKEILEARQNEREQLASRIEKLEKIHPNSRHSFK